MCKIIPVLEKSRKGGWKRGGSGEDGVRDQDRKGKGTEGLQAG